MAKANENVGMAWSNYSKCVKSMLFFS